MAIDSYELCKICYYDKWIGYVYGMWALKFQIVDNR